MQGSRSRLMTAKPGDTRVELIYSSGNPNALYNTSGCELKNLLRNPVSNPSALTIFKYNILSLLPQRERLRSISKKASISSLLVPAVLGGAVVLRDARRWPPPLPRDGLLPGALEPPLLKRSSKTGETEAGRRGLRDLLDCRASCTETHSCFQKVALVKLSSHFGDEACNLKKIQAFKTYYFHTWPHHCQICWPMRIWTLTSSFYPSSPS